MWNSLLKIALAREDDGRFSLVGIKFMLTFLDPSPGQKHIGSAYSNRGRKMQRGAKYVYEGRLGSVPLDTEGIEVGHRELE